MQGFKHGWAWACFALALGVTFSEGVKAQDLEGWPGRPRLAAAQMIAKYGQPQHVSAEKLIWENQGPWKRIVVSRKEVPHDFPKPHFDFVSHTIDYAVPADKAGALLAFDGSLVIDRTAGELSAKCDSETHNIFALNLANDIVTGKLDAEQARRQMAKLVADDLLGQTVEGAPMLTFKPMKSAAARDTSAATPEGEILAFVMAIDESALMAANEAGRKRASDRVASFAAALRKDHGADLQKAMDLAQQLNATAVDTAAVDRFRVNQAEGLAKLVPLDGSQFESAFFTAMADGHGEVLQLIDRGLMPKATSPALKTHLEELRNHVQHHLDEARQASGEGREHPGNSLSAARRPDGYCDQQPRFQPVSCPPCPPRYRRTRCCWPR